MIQLTVNAKTRQFDGDVRLRELPVQKHLGSTPASRSGNQ